MDNLPLTFLTTLATSPASNDVLYIVDVSDTTQSPQGTSKKIQFDTLTSTFVTASSTTTLTNKTINGNNNTLTILAASQLSGITPVANGGTGANTLTSGSVLVGNGTSAVSLVATSGSGNFVRATSPTLVTPVLGAATATSINGLIIDTTTGTFDLTNGKTLAVTNTLTLSGTDSTVMTFPGATDTVAGLTATQTLTNKRITRRVGTVTSSATPTINTDNVDFYSITALATDITSMTTNLSGTPTNAQTLWIAITDNGTPRTITWGSSFESSTIALPTTTVTSTRLDIALVWNTATSKWRCVGVA